VQERVLEGRQKVLGPQHVETLAALGNLAVTMRALGDASGARKIEEGLVASRAVLCEVWQKRSRAARAKPPQSPFPASPAMTLPTSGKFTTG
jgi:Tetratricopeptide repeat